MQKIYIRENKCKVNVKELVGFPIKLTQIFNDHIKISTVKSSVSPIYFKNTDLSFLHSLPI